MPLCPPPLRPPPYLDYNFAPSSSSSSDNYNDNNNDLMVQAKLDMYVPPHQYPSQVGVGVSSPTSWGSTQYEHSTYHYTTKHIPPPPPLSYHNGYGTQYPHHPQHSYPTYPPQGGGGSSGSKYSHYAPVPSHSFSVNVNVMTPSAAAAAVAATPSSSQLVNLFGHPTTTSSQCVICTTCFLKKKRLTHSIYFYLTYFSVVIVSNVKRNTGALANVCSDFRSVRKCLFFTKVLKANLISCFYIFNSMTF